MKKGKFFLIELAGADGGMFPYLNGLSREISSLEYDCTVFTSCHVSKDIHWSKNTLVKYAFGRLKIHGHSMLKLISLLRGLFVLWWNCIVQRPKFKNLHVFRLDEISVLIGLVMRMCFGRFALTVHDVTPLKGGETKNSAVMRLALRIPDVIVVHNEFVKKEVERIVGDRQNIVIMPHGIDTPQDTITVHDRKAESRVTFGVIGSLKKTKGIIDAIEAFEILSQSTGNCRLRIVGKDLDNLEITIQERIAQLNFPERCEFENRFLSEKEFQIEILNSDVVIVPYHQIYQSGVAVTAASLGRAIIASDLPGMRSTLGHAAVFFEPGDANALAKAMAKLADSAEMRANLADSARQHVSRDFSWRNAAKKLIDGLEGTATN